MKTIKFALVAVMVMSTASLFAQQKFARINSQEIIAVMPETAKTQTDMQAYVKDLQDNMEAITTEYQTKLQDYQKNYNTWPDATRQMKEKELTEISQRRDEFQQTAQDDIQRKQQELMAPIVSKAKQAIDKVALAAGYTAVFDTSTGALVYFDEASLPDLAPAVHKEMGITEEQAKAALAAAMAPANNTDPAAAPATPAPIN